MSAVGDARKRLEAQHQRHPEPSVRDLIERAMGDAWEEGYRAGDGDTRDWAGTTDNPYRSAP